MNAYLDKLFKMLDFIPTQQINSFIGSYKCGPKLWVAKMQRVARMCSQGHHIQNRELLNSSCNPRLPVQFA